MKPPLIILASPQMGENIGATARVMMNFGLEKLRIVTPRDGWPNPKAFDNAVGAVAILENAEIFPSLPAALHDVHKVYATSARKRYMTKPLTTSRELAPLLETDATHGLQSAIMFGPERTGLSNDEVTLADILVTIPVSPRYASLNLAQSVGIIAYEWWVSQQNKPLAVPHATSPMLPASQEALQQLMHLLETSLEARDFFKAPNKQAGMKRSIYNILKRMQPTEQELRTLLGMIRALNDIPPKSPKDPHPTNH